MKDREFERYIQSLEDPNYKGGSWSLPEDATPSEKTKYELCKKVIIYKREKKLNTEQIAEKIKLSLAETDDILHYRTNYFTLERLMNYVGELFPILEVKIFTNERTSQVRL